MPHCDKCQQHFPNTIVISGKRRNLQSRRYCLACSPFGAHNTRDLQAVAVPLPVSTAPLPVSRRCPRCGEVKSIVSFYRNRKTGKVNSYCKACANRQTVERQQELKKKIVEYLGGCCVRCGYNRYIGSLEVHHRDPNEKDFDLAHVRSTSFEKVKAELDKCMLLCANCHREEHARLKGLLVE